MTALHLAPLYPILDVVAGRASRAFELADALLGAGTPWLQLRAKETSARDHLSIARELVARAGRHRGHVIVNDRLDVARASGAAGVHLGQTDLPLAAAREIATEARLLVGISTHDVEQARAAERHGADYIGFGPIFATHTKTDALEPRAAGALAQVRDAVALPIVAIGGITEATAAAVLAEGATSVAMIGAVASAEDPAALARRLLALAAPEKGQSS